MARTSCSEQSHWACPFHCASAPPVFSAGMVIQDMVPHWGSVSGGFEGCRWHSLGKVSGLLNAFSGVVSNNYWSSTTNAANTTNAWIVNLNNGNVNNTNKTNNNYVWPVRAGE